MQNVNWTEINAKLPVAKTKEESRARVKMFRAMDGNGNGFLSLAEIDKGIRDVLLLDEVFDCKAAIMRAFQAAKDKYKSKSKYGPDYIELMEFRFLLVYLRQFFEYKVMFDKLDVTGDKKVGLEEFKQAIPTVEKWGAKIGNVEATFNEISQGDGGLTFIEFCQWAIKLSLDLEDDDDLDTTEELK